MSLAMQVPFTLKGDFFFRFKNASKILLWSCTGAVVTHHFVIHNRHLLPSALECLNRHSYSSWWVLPLKKYVFCKYFCLLPLVQQHPAYKGLCWTPRLMSQLLAVSPIIVRISIPLLRLLNKIQEIKLTKRFSSKKPDDLVKRNCPVSKLSCVGRGRGLNPARCDGSQQQLVLRVYFSTVKWVEGTLPTFVGKMNCLGEQWILLCWKYSIHVRILNNVT